MNTFGELLKNLRKERGFSQRDLATQVEVDFTYLSKIENGVLPPPADDTIIRLAKTLAVDADELLLAAKRIPPDLSDLVVRSKTVPALLRSTKDLSEQQLREVLDFVERFRHEQ